jgi:hypothetical protein
LQWNSQWNRKKVGPGGGEHYEASTCLYGTRANVLFSISPSTLLKTVGDKSIYLYTSPFNLNLIFPRPLFHFFLCNSQSDCPHLSLIKKNAQIRFTFGGWPSCQECWDSSWADVLSGHGTPGKRLCSTISRILWRSSGWPWTCFKAEPLLGIFCVFNRMCKMKTQHLRLADHLEESQFYFTPCPSVHVPIGSRFTARHQPHSQPNWPGVILVEHDSSCFLSAMLSLIPTSLLVVGRLFVLC